MFRCATITPLGTPVLPEVNRTYATPSGETSPGVQASAASRSCLPTNVWPGNRRSSSDTSSCSSARISIGGPSASITSASCARDSRSATIERQPERWSMTFVRSTGNVRFSGTYPCPRSRIPRTPPYAANVRYANIAVRAGSPSGACRCSVAAIRAACSRSSR
jgi:hypothetical protein